MNISLHMVLRRVTVWTVVLLGLVQCKSINNQLQLTQYQLVPVDQSYSPDSVAEATIQPYRQLLEDQMEVVIGHSNKRLVEAKVESLLGNFVTDAILLQSAKHYPQKIHLSVVTNGGLRAPIPEGPVKIANIYELMPFENLLYILELNGSQTQYLFDKVATSKNVAVANSVVIIEGDKPARIFIDGTPFDQSKQYVLAVSDYLAQGGGGMGFLKGAKVLATVDVKIRDLIIEYIKELNSRGIAVDAEIEGRVKLLP